MISARAADLAAVLVEPVQGSAGMIPASADYLARLREITARLGIPLIFDEVVSFRVAWGGAQEHFGVTPDLTVLGKLIGGGLPLGAFGGRADIMTLFDPSRGPPAVPHPGSYNANPMSLAAGAATLDLLTRQAIADLNRAGQTLRERLRRAFEECGVAVQVTGLGSLFGIHPTSRPVRSRRDADTADRGFRHRLFLGLYNEGVLIDPRGVGTLSTLIGAPEIDRFVEGLQAVLARAGNLDVRPSVQKF
jgi:glutamate-1-semialdehyde 2,1-aminomutase